jgi:diadenosine tetraphosphate (Ap4A) HIT family hydrolase
MNKDSRHKNSKNKTKKSSNHQISTDKCTDTPRGRRRDPKNPDLSKTNRNITGVTSDITSDIVQISNQISNQKNTSKEIPKPAWLGDTIKEIMKEKKEIRQEYKPFTNQQYQQYQQVSSEDIKQNHVQPFSQQSVASSAIPIQETKISDLSAKPDLESRPLMSFTDQSVVPIPNNPITDMRNSILGQLNSYQDSMLHNLKDHISQSIDKEISRKIKNVSLSQSESKKQKKPPRTRCYTCRPRGKVKKHVIGKSSCNNFVFHHDMNHRPFILITPVEHITEIDNMSPEILKQMFKSITYFCNFWNIKDYEISYRMGAWRSNEHFHIKIKVSDKIANRMRGDHFKKIKFEDRYHETKN